MAAAKPPPPTPEGVVCPFAASGDKAFSGGTEADPGRSSGLLVTAATGAGEDRVAGGPDRLVNRMAWVVAGLERLEHRGCGLGHVPGCGHADAPPVSAVQPNRKSDGYLCYLWEKRPEIAGDVVYLVPSCLAVCQPVSLIRRRRPAPAPPLVTFPVTQKALSLIGKDL
jgi:hypothetical protein